MAIKAALAAALLVALVAAASATTITTTTITTTSHEDEAQGSQQCGQRLQGREFQSCQSYLRQQGSSSQPYQADPQQQKCCQELREMDQYQCGCEAIRRAAQKVQQQGGSSYQGQGQGQGQGQSEQIYRAASELPRVCGLRQQQCSFSLAIF